VTIQSTERPVFAGTKTPGGPLQIGWKGLINDPHLDGSYDVDTGLRIGRRLLLAINQLGLPAATEFLDPVVPQYLADLITWAAIGVSIVPKPAESCRTEIHAFSVSMRTFSSGISASVSSFFKLGPRAFQARPAYSRSASTIKKPIPHR
jgi:phospho-2-dehydro-3-deoxyheptonate aldolase